MPATPSELLHALHSTLSSLIDHFEVIDGAEAKAKAAVAQLNATAQELSMASKRLENVKRELTKAEASLEGKHHVINDEAARALQDVNRQIATKQEDLRGLEARIKEARANHDNIVAGMQSLVQRLRV